MGRSAGATRDGKRERERNEIRLVSPGPDSPTPGLFAVVVPGSRVSIFHNLFKIRRLRYLTGDLLYN
jgi:hypothetical protein